jgi:hypothetical protein
MILLNSIGYEWEKTQVTGTLDGHCKAALVLQAGARDATWQDFALVVQEFPQEVWILVVDVLDPVALEAAIFLGHVGRLDLVYSRRAYASVFAFTV